MYEWARPNISIPVHGEARHLEAHAELALELGVDDAFSPRNGDLIRIAPDGPELIDEVPAGRLHRDGHVFVPDGATGLRERRKLSLAGVMIVSVVFDSKQRLSREIGVDGIGIVFGDDDGQSDYEEIAIEIEEAIMKLSREKRKDDAAVELVIKRAVRIYFDEAWGKRPIISAIIHRITS